MVNVAESEQFVVELVAIARGVRFEDEESDTDDEVDIELDDDDFGLDGGSIEDDATEGGTDDSVTVSDVYFFHVENTSDEPVQWWYDEHYFFSDDDFQFDCGENVSSGWGNDTVEVLPAHWYPAPEIQPGRKARCVAEFADPPADVTVEQIAYQYEDDQYVIDVEPAELDEPPI